MSFISLVESELSLLVLACFKYSVFTSSWESSAMHLKEPSSTNTISFKQLCLVAYCTLALQTAGMMMYNMQTTQDYSFSLIAFLQ